MFRRRHYQYNKNNYTFLRLDCQALFLSFFQRPLPALDQAGVKALLPAEDALANHVPAQGAVVLVEAQQHLVELPLGIGAAQLQLLGDFLQADALLLPLGGD